MSQRRAATGLIHEIQLHPCPARILAQLNLIPGELSLNSSDELASAFGSFRSFNRVGRASLTNDPHRIHAVRAEPESPQKARRSDFGVNLAVFVAVLHTNRVVGRNGAVELGGTCLLFWHVLTINDSLGCKAVAVLRSHSDVPGCHISGHPDL